MAVLKGGTRKYLGGIGIAYNSTYLKLQSRTEALSLQDNHPT